VIRFDMSRRTSILVILLALTLLLAYVPLSSPHAPAAKHTVPPRLVRNLPAFRPTTRALKHGPSTAPFVFTSYGRPIHRRLARPLPSETAATTDQPAAPQPIYTEDMAYAALSYVGLDDQANEVWYTAINDPALPPDARQDLIAGLGAEGLPDVRNLTAADLPLIDTRLAIIEGLAPDADDDNADAFASAYQELLAMHTMLASQPQADSGAAGGAAGNGAENQPAGTAPTVSPPQQP